MILNSILPPSIPRKGVFMCVQTLWGTGENLAGAFCDSFGFIAVTSAVWKSAPALQERDKRISEGRPFCSWSCCFLQSSSRSYFRDAFFATSALKFVKLAETAFWVVFGILSTFFCCQPAPFSYAKRTFVQWVANFAFSGIAFVGFCFPKAGVQIYCYLLNFLQKIDETFKKTVHHQLTQIIRSQEAIDKRIGKPLSFVQVQLLAVPG